MRRIFLIGAALAGVVSASPGLADRNVNKVKINGWYACHGSAADPYAESALVAPFECAEVQVPLCHTGICTSSKTINLFVRRLLAKKKTANSHYKVIWHLQGGPGSASVVMEEVMLMLNEATNATVDLYTLDHRGTGRSNFLECKASQAFAAGSPHGIEAAYSEIPNCIKEIMFQIDNHTKAFSVTSAAKDIELLINTFHGNEKDVFIYGASYGTYLATRVMHLAPKQVKGYILDGAVDEKRTAFTKWNTDRKPASDRFIKECEDDKLCSFKLAKEIKTHGGLTPAIRALYNRLDAAKPGADKCADILRNLTSVEGKPSHVLRNFLGTTITYVTLRLFVPIVLHRTYNCGAKDGAFLKAFLEESIGDNSSDSGSSASTPAPVPAVKDLV